MIIIGAVIAAIAFIVIISKADMWMPVTVLGLAGAACYYGLSSWLRKTPAAAKPPAPKIITHVITHVVTRPGKPTLTGGDVVIIICVLAVLVTGYLLARGRRPRSN